MAHAIAFGLLAVVLCVAAVTDWRTGKVFNWLTFPAMLAGLAYWLAVGWLTGGGGGKGEPMPGWSDALIGLTAGLIPFALIITAGGLGPGDMKLMGAVGALSASWKCVFATSVYAFLIGGFMAVAIMIRSGLVKRTFARLLGAVLMLAARSKPELPDDSPRIPFSVAIAVGGLIAGAEQMLGLHTPWRAWGL